MTVRTVVTTVLVLGVCLLVGVLLNGALELFGR